MCTPPPGVDLSTICLSYGEGDDRWLQELRSQADIITAVGSERAKPEDAAGIDTPQVLAALQVMATACGDEDAGRASNAKKLLGGQSMHNTIANLLSSDDRAVVQAGLGAIKVRGGGDPLAPSAFSSHHLWAWFWLTAPCGWGSLPLPVPPPLSNAGHLSG